MNGVGSSLPPATLVYQHYTRPFRQHHGVTIRHTHTHIHTHTHTHTQTLARVQVITGESKGIMAEQVAARQAGRGEPVFVLSLARL
jgi:hypothetical protein